MPHPRTGSRNLRALAFLLLAARTLLALDPGVAPADYLHTSWTQDAGNDLPAVFALAQTADGYLWLGTSDGLIRFDGMRFVRWSPLSGPKLPDNRIRYLRASLNGALWIGTESGIYRLDRGRIQDYPAANHWLGGRVSAMAVDLQGGLWMIGPGSRSEIALVSENGALQIYGPADGVPAQRLRSLFFDRLNNLWVSTVSGICKWLPGKPASCSTAPELDTIGVVENAVEHLLPLIRLDRTNRQPTYGNGETARSGPAIQSGANRETMRRRPASPSLTARAMLRDRDGNFWIGTIDQGLYRLRDGLLERFTRRDGLSSDVINSMVEDREGNLWVATAKGIDRFRDPKFVRLSSLNGLSSSYVTAVLPSSHGGAWVATTSGLNHVVGEAISQYGADSGLPSPVVGSLYLDASNKLWAATSGGLAYLSNRRFIEVQTVDRLKLIRVMAMITGPDGNLWLIDEMRGLFAIRGGVARPLKIPGLETKDIFQLFRDRDGIVWFGHFVGGLSTLQGSSLRRFGPKDGLPEGSVQAIAQDRSGAVWIGTRSGLSRFRQGRWTTWSGRQGIPEEGVRGIIEDDYGALWLITAKGLLRTPFAALNETPDGEPARLNLVSYGFNDGLKPGRSATMGNPRGGKAADGRIWIGTEDGLAIVDPSRIRNNPVPPPAAIEELLVDGRRMDPDSLSVIRFKGELVQITYTGLSLMVPERVNFKYILEGHDHEWIDAVTRRNASYVNLPPGPYRFRVMAANNDGLWNTVGAALIFRVDPYFYQTNWFLAICVIVPALIAWGVHWMRMRRLAYRFQLIAQERARLTRELHDSLLQGFSGVVYQLEAAKRQFESAPVVSKQRLERAIEQADQSLQEARRAMQSMRLSALENSTLPEALSAIAARLTEGTSVHFHLEVSGRMRHPSYDAQAGVYMIGREAIANAVNHAHATRIQAGLTYTDTELRLVVQDNGRGFDPQSAMSKSGHWGWDPLESTCRHASLSIL